MATVTQTCDLLATLTGVEPQSIALMARRLGEADMLPRGPRGRHAPHIQATDLAVLITGTLVLTSGDRISVGAIPAMVSRVLNYSTTEPAYESVMFALNPNGTFGDVLARYVERGSWQPEDRIEAIGLHRLGVERFAWMRWTGQPDYGVAYLPAGMSAPLRRDNPLGLVRDNHFTSEAIEALLGLLRSETA